MLQTMLKRAPYSIRLVYPYKPTLLVSLFFSLITVYSVLFLLLVISYMYSLYIVYLFVVSL